MLNVVAVPVEGVKVFEVGTTLRLTSPRFAGGVSATRTKLTFAVVVPPPPPPVPPPPPPPTVPCLKSWQAERSMAVAKVAKRKDLVCFIEYPTRMMCAAHAVQIASVEPQAEILRGTVKNRILENKGGCSSTK